MAHDATGHVFDAGHDLAEEVPEEMAAVMVPFLAERYAGRRRSGRGGG